MKTILVIASNSFTGAHFVDHALKRGDRVVGIGVLWSILRLCSLSLS